MLYRAAVIGDSQTVMGFKAVGLTTASANDGSEAAVQLHKLADIFPLAESNIKYLDIHFSAARVSGTRIAEVLLQMPAIDGASVSMIDEGKNNRYRIICKHLARMGRESIVWHVGGYAKWLEL